MSDELDRTLEPIDTNLIIEECAAFVKSELPSDIPLDIILILTKCVFVALQRKGFVISKVRWELVRVKK